MGTAVKHPVPDWIKLSFVILHIRALWCSVLGVRVPGCQNLQMMSVWYRPCGNSRCQMVNRLLSIYLRAVLCM